MEISQSLKGRVIHVYVKLMIDTSLEQLGKFNFANLGQTLQRVPL